MFQRKNVRETDKKRSLFSFFLIALSLNLAGQSSNDSFLVSLIPFKMALTVSLDDIMKTRTDSSYLNVQVIYQNAKHEPDSISVGIQGRGNFRYRECYFPPLWVKVKPSDARRTVFQGNKKFKLVLPCKDRRGNNELIVREYLCYKLYEEVTPFSFQTRLADIDLTMIKKRKRERYQAKGIFIEDVNHAADRLHARPVKSVKINPHAIHDTSAVRFEFFQYMISNTDWAIMHQHNAKLLVQGHHKYVSVMYDFDMSGLVDAPYAVVSAINGKQMDASRVTQRIYRGFCRDPEIMEFVRQEFLSKRNSYLSIVEQLAEELSAKEIKDIRDYLDQFFTILKDDRLFNNNILDKCRTE